MVIVTHTTPIAEMANRITERLKKWSVMNEDDLKIELENLRGEIPDDEMKRYDRRVL